MKRTSTLIDPDKYISSIKVVDNKITPADIEQLLEIYDPDTLQFALESGLLSKDDVNKLLIERNNTNGIVDSRTSTVLDDEVVHDGELKLLGM